MAAKQNREQMILDFINEYSNSNGYPPSVREICAGVGLSSPSSVHDYIKRLEEKGLLIKDASKTRALKLAPTQTEQMCEPIAEYLSVPVVGHQMN